MDKFKYLGIILDSSLNFEAHVKYLKGKLYAKIKLLGRVRRLLDHNTALTIYKTLILPVLDYCDHVYYGISASDKEVLQRLQNCAFRSILNVDTYTHTSDTHNTLNMDRLDDRRKKHVSIQMYKFLKCDGPSTCREMFTYMIDYHSVNTRSTRQDQLLVLRVNLSMAHRNIRYFGSKTWMEIPPSIKAQPTLDLFKECIYAYNFE